MQKAVPAFTAHHYILRTQHEITNYSVTHACTVWLHENVTKTEYALCIGAEVAGIQ